MKVNISHTYCYYVVDFNYPQDNWGKTRISSDLEKVPEAPTAMRERNIQGHLLRGWGNNVIETYLKEQWSYFLRRIWTLGQITLQLGTRFPEILRDKNSELLEKTSAEALTNWKSDRRPLGIAQKKLTSFRLKFHILPTWYVL